VKLSLSLRDFFDALVHPSARADALAAAQHRAFMAPRLFAGLIALGLLPVFLALRGAPTVLEFAVLAWVIVPLASAYFLSCSGRYEAAHIVSALGLTGIVIMVAVNSGGINSFAMVWLVLISLEAAISGSRRVVAITMGFALAAVALLIFFGTPLTPQWDLGRTAIAALGIASGLLYAGGVAIGADSVVQTNAKLLTREKEQFWLLAENMTDVITRHDQNGRVLFASPNAEAVLGTPADALYGHGLLDRIHIADRPACLAALSDAAASSKTLNVEFRLSRTLGETGAARFIWIEMRCRRCEENGAFAPPAGPLIAVLRDVTDRKVQENALIEARAQAEQANVAKSRFLAVMSHELRTPLNAIIGFSEMLSTPTEARLDCKRRQEYAQLINESGHHLLAVVNDVLDMSRLETGGFEITVEPFKLPAVMTSCRDLLVLKACDNGVELTCEAPAELPDLVADKRAVKQILINLISNAIKFTNRGGTVQVSAAIDGQHILIIVDDTGIGIAPDDLARIGDPFFQVRGSYARRHDGAGLGLSIVKGLVKLHGGEFEITSSLGEGTRVVVRLPLDCECGRGATASPCSAALAVTAVSAATRNAAATANRSVPPARAYAPPRC
jgi:two-component system, cell cycle sensor histidine kinase DivJ